MNRPIRIALPKAIPILIILIALSIALQAQEITPEPQLPSPPTSTPPPLDASPQDPLPDTLPTDNPAPTLTPTLTWPTVTPVPFTPIPQPQALIFDASIVEGKVMVTLYNSVQVEWVQVWIGTSDLELLHLEWYELATAATCSDDTCTLSIDLVVEEGTYVTYVQPWGENLGFIENDLEGWLGPVEFETLSMLATATPNPTPMPLPEQNIPPRSAAALNNDPAKFYHVFNTQDLMDAFNDTLGVPLPKKVILIEPGSTYELPSQIEIVGEIYIVGNSSVSPIDITQPDTVADPVDTVVITKASTAPNGPIFRSATNFQYELSLYNVQLTGRGDISNDTEGLIFIAGRADVSLIETRIDSGTSFFGGGVQFIGGNQSFLNVFKTRFTQNYATDAGGAIYVSNGSNVTIECSHFEENTVNTPSFTNGSAISNNRTFPDFGPEVAVINSNFIDNNDNTGASSAKTLFNADNSLTFTLDGVYIDDNVPSTITETNSRQSPFDITTCTTPDFLPPITCPIDTSGLPSIITDKCAAILNSGVITVDDVPGNARVLSSTASANDGICLLEEAVDTANTLAANILPSNSDCLPSQPGGNIVLEPGQFIIEVTPNATYLFITSVNPMPVIGNGLDLAQGQKVEITIQPRGIENETPSQPVLGTTISTRLEDPYRIFEIAEGSTLKLNRITVSGGVINSQNDPARPNGGGIYNAGTLILQNDGGVINNSATGNGGGIYNTSTGIVRITEATISGNTANGNGGAIFSEGLDTIVYNSIFQNNAALTGNGAVFFGNVATIRSNCILHDVNSGPTDIAHNDPNSILSFHTATIDAGLNWWGDPSGPGNPYDNNNNPPQVVADIRITLGVNAASYIDQPPTIPGGCFQRMATPIHGLNSPGVFNPGFYAPNPTIAASFANRIPGIEVQYRLFRDSWQQYGLPPAFDLMPYRVVQAGQITTQPPQSNPSTDPLGWYRSDDAPNPVMFPAPNTSVTIPVQGFGPTSGSVDLGLYGRTFFVHSGLDYGSGPVDDLNRIWFDRVLVSLCDGIVVNGNNITGPSPTGGSAQPGRGVSIRCFMDDLDSPRSDTDDDGNPNLSNIIVTYNHLLGTANTGTIDCSWIQYFTDCSGVYQLAREGDVVRRGEPIGQTGARDDPFDHLHLAIFLAKDFNRSRSQGGGPVIQGQEDNAFYLNPLLLYTGNIMGQHELQSYFFNGGTILVADLHPLSAGGFNSGAPEGSDRANYMQAVQTTNSGIEWPQDLYPLEDSSINAAGTVTLNSYLSQQFSSYVASAPNCELQVDVSISPSRLTINPTNCTLQDMSQEGSLPLIPHNYP